MYFETHHGIKSHLSKPRKRIGEACTKPRKRLYNKTPTVDDRGGQVASTSSEHDIPSININDPSHLEYEEMMLSTPIKHEHEVMGYLNSPSKSGMIETKTRIREGY